jgi:acetoin utilization protein AcuC
MSLILVIDDEPPMRRMIKRVLGTAGHEVIEAHDGVSGLRLVRSREPAVVITDIVMPGMEGIETILHIRRASPLTRIVAISGAAGWGAPLYLEWAQRLGADDVLVKPNSWRRSIVSSVPIGRPPRAEQRSRRRQFEAIAVDAAGAIALSGKMSEAAWQSPILIGSEIYRGSTYGSRHPLAIPRVSTTLDLIRALGWIAPDRYLDSPLASDDELARFHARDYIAALRRAESSQHVAEADRQRYQIGCNGNPIFTEMFRRPATAAGASLMAADLLAAQGGIVHSPAGGTHHGRPDRASGFCYFNDPVLGMLRLLDRGLTRILYVDLDAHHADGVEAAFAADERVLVCSVHEAGRWPFTGTASTGFAYNFPVPPGFNDSELDLIVERALIPCGQRFHPQVLVLQCGADGLAEDPMSKLELSNGAIWRAVAALMALAPRILVLGGGGYNPWAVARCWTGIWAVLNGYDLPSRLPDAAETVLRGLTWHHSLGRNPPERWFTTLADPPRLGPVRPEVVDLVVRMAA